MTTDVTPQTLSGSRHAAQPRRRRTDSRWLKALGLVVGLATTVVTGYYSGIAAVGDRDRAQGERIAAVETRVEDHYKAIIGRLDQIEARQAEDRRDTRADYQRIRDEILQILREVRR